jgi:hypothetical protein
VVGPDLRGCETHGLADYRVYRYKNGRTERRCLVCQRERQASVHNNGVRCRRGHLKTPWSWRYYSGIWRCLTCQYVARKLSLEKQRSA